MIEITRAPFSAHEVINFDYVKLTGFLTFLESNLCLASTEIVGIKRKISCLDDIKQDINNINLTLKSFEKRFDSIESSIFSHQQKLLEIEAFSKSHEHRISVLEEFSNTTNLKLNKIEENITFLEKSNEENVQNIESLRKFVKENSTSIIKINTRIDGHDHSIDNIYTDVNKFRALEKNITYKFKKSKTKFNDRMEQISRKFNEIDNNIGIVMENVEIDPNKIKLNKIDFSNHSEGRENDTIFHHNAAVENSEFKSFVEKTDKNFHSIFDEIKEINKKFNEKQSLQEGENVFKELFSSSSKEGGDKAFEILKEIQKNEKFILSNLFNKISKEDLEKVTKEFKSEIEKIYQRMNSNFSSSPEAGFKRGAHLYHTTKPGIKEREEMNKELQEDFRIQFFKLIQEDERLNKTFNLHETFQDEMTKLNDLISFLQSQMKTHFENFDLDSIFSTFNTKFDEIFGKMTTMQLYIDSVSKSETIEVENKEVGSVTSTSIKDFVRALSTGLKHLNEKVDKISLKLENLNSEVLSKIKKDLLSESYKVLDEFRLDLKGNIFRIQEQMREKVDKINMDEFSRKFEVKLINEISKKLDRNDLRKNTNLINRKIESLESKISKTLVDTLIDLQLDDAPLLVKKTQKGGSDKCGSCNQFLPNQTSGNLLSQLNCQILAIEEKSSQSNFPVNNSTSINFKKTAGNNNRNRNREGLPEAGMKTSASAFSINILPEIAGTNSIATNTVNNKINAKRIVKDSVSTPKKKVANNSQPIKYLDEFAERQLNNMINEELEKDILRPELLMRASNKIFDSIDKKFK